MGSEAVLKYPIVFLSAFCATYLLTPLVAKAAVALRIVDYPSERRINKTPVPRAGGIAVFVGFQIGAAAVFLLPWKSFQGSVTLDWWMHFIAISSVLLLVGLIDDVRSLSPVLKLAGQVLVALLFYMHGFTVGRILGLPLPEFLNIAATVFWYLALINAFNLIDGLDGLASGLGAIAAVGMAGAMAFSWQPGSTLVLLALAGACLAFLRFNFQPAKIYLGDSGSMFIGVAIASIALQTSAKGTALASIGFPLLAAGIPLFDTMLAVWRRSMRKLLVGRSDTRIMGPDLEHLHHRLLKTGLTQRRVAVLLYAASAVLVSVGLLTITFSSHQAGIFLLAFVLGSYVVVRHVAHTELWDSGTLIVRGLRRPRSAVLAAVLYPAVDFLSLVVSLGMTLFLIEPQETFSELKFHWFSRIPIWCALPFIVLALSGVYSRVWSRARISEYFLLAVALFLGVAISLALRIGLEPQILREAILKAVLHFSISGIFITAARAFPRTVSDLMILYDSARLTDIRPTKRLLVYGAGDRCTLLLRQIGFGLLNNGVRRQVVGLLDDDENLRKRKVHGHEVLGGMQELHQALASHKIDEIVVACELPIDKLNALVEIARSRGFSLSCWQTEYQQFDLSEERLDLREAVLSSV